MTDAERRLWRGLRESFPEFHWRKQVPMGPFYADFISHRARLVLEVDGSQHADVAEYDARRTHLLNDEGYRVLRFWNNDVTRNLDGVLNAIAAHLPSPLVGEVASKRPMGGARRSRAPAV